MLPLISSAEQQLKNYGDFLKEHDKKLTNILSRFNAYNKEKALLKEPLIQSSFSRMEEDLLLVKLLESERPLNKTLFTLGHLCGEIDEISSDAKRMQLEFLYKNEELLVVMESTQYHNMDLYKKNKAMIYMSKCLEFFYQIQFLLQRCILVANNLIHQCGAILAQNKFEVEIQLMVICEYLSKLFLDIIIFDEILNKSNFTRCWHSYKKTIEAMANSNNVWSSCTSSEMCGLRNCLEELDFLFVGDIFRHFLYSTFSIKEKLGSHGLGQLTMHFNEYMKMKLLQIDKTNSTASNEIIDVYSIVKLNVFCVVCHDFCGKVDSKSVKFLLELNAKLRVIVLIGNIPWSSTDFLRKNALTLIKMHEYLLPEIRRQQQLFVQYHSQKLAKDCSFYRNEISLWMLKIDNCLSSGLFDLRTEKFKELALLLVRGIRTSCHLSYIIKGIVNAHENLQLPMTNTILLSICKLLEMLKLVQTSFNHHNSSIVKKMHCILQYSQYKVLLLINICKKKIISSKLCNKSVDALAALKVTERCLHGPSTKLRLLLSKLAFEDANCIKHTILSIEQKQRFRTLMKRIDLITGLQDVIKEICDTSFLFWHQSMVEAYLKQIVDRTIDFNSFKHFIQASTESANSLNILNLKDSSIARGLQKSTYESIRSEIVSKLCTKIEVFLRLEVHVNLPVGRINPFNQGIHDYKELINICPLEVNGIYVILKNHIENYLSAMFYNLTTISLYDWKTYEEMRYLANYRSSLDPVEDYLPNQSLEQGIDILEIMRKIHIFVSKYAYNMNSQIFVEQQSSNKHLDTIGICHVANSLRTHGTGVVNTTVNFIYQFLKQKFYAFSQFLYDEQIKSLLMKEFRWFMERKQQDKYPLYPYERADAFNKGIRKFGLADNGQTYMDLFRKVITHIGNAIGYIRLVRSGSIHANYNASLYIPKFDENLEFASQCKEQYISDVAQVAAENIEQNIKNLAMTFADNTNYFKLLIEAFQPFFRNPQNLHLRNFFLIVPAIIMNNTEYMLDVKSNINKKDREEAVLFDDGFGIGLSYILKLLNQINDFNSLQWFTTVQGRFDAERRKIKEMLLEINSSAGNVTSKANTNTAATKKNENEKLQQTLVLTERRINSHQMEYNLFYYNLCSANIFFQ